MNLLNQIPVMSNLIGRSAGRKVLNSASPEDARSALGLNADLSASSVGRSLIDVLLSAWGSNAGTCFFATITSTSVTFLVKTSTGYARLINPDGSLATQQGAGVAGSNITLTIPAGGGVRAFGVLSVANTGSVRSGNITYLAAPSCWLTASYLSGLTALTSLALNGNRLTSFSGLGLGALLVLTLSLNSITEFSGEGLSSLADLDASYNSISIFAGSAMVALSNCVLSHNELAEFSSFNSVLTALDLDYNNLSSFVSSGFSLVTDLSLIGNSLTSLNFAGLDVITFAYASDNSLSAAEVDAFFNSVATSSVDGEIDITGNSAPTAASASARVDLVSAGFTLYTD